MIPPLLGAKCLGLLAIPCYQWPRAKHSARLRDSAILSSWLVQVCSRHGSFSFASCRAHLAPWCKAPAPFLRHAVPSWDLGVGLDAITKAPYYPLHLCDLKHLTKGCFRLACKSPYGVFLPLLAQMTRSCGNCAWRLPWMLMCPPRSQSARRLPNCLLLWGGQVRPASVKQRVPTW